MRKKMVKCGIMPYEQFRERTVKIAKGEYKPGKDEPKIWFESVRAMAQILSEENMSLLKTIGITKPESITALAQITGRKKNNLSRTLKKMQQYGIVELREENRSLRPVLRATDFRIDYGLNSYPFLSDEASDNSSRHAEHI